MQQNKLGFNVAYAGELEKTRISLVVGSTPNKIVETNDLKWQQVTLDLPLANKLSTGTIFSKIAVGSFSQLQIKQAFSYKVDLAEEQSLSVGFAVSFNQQNIDFRDNFTPNDFVDLNDPFLDREKMNENKLGLELGMVYNLKNFQFSLAIPSIGNGQPYANEINAYAEYRFKLGEDLDLTPSVLFMQTQSDQFELINNLNLKYQKKGWIQVGHADIGQVMMGFGLNIKGLGIGYNFGYFYKDKISEIFGNNHQFGLFFNL
jgi:type IX secretion system PorP/SprF family membrane protein